MVNKIIYKAKQYGIDVIVREESYTSLDLDDIPIYGLVKSGTRVRSYLIAAACFSRYG